jgi:hypothetical protein
VSVKGVFHETRRHGAVRIKESGSGSSGSETKPAHPPT